MCRAINLTMTATKTGLIIKKKKSHISGKRRVHSANKQRTPLRSQLRGACLPSSLTGDAEVETSLAAAVEACTTTYFL